MTATDELRRMLDERGVEWHGDIATYWRDADAVESLFADNALDVSLYAVSPEQAIEATLGRESHQPWAGELDLENVVRCKDCRYWDTRYECFKTCELHMGEWGAEDYCSYGERRRHDGN